MSDLVSAIRYGFLERPHAPAQRAAAYFKSASEAALANTLRSHEDKTIEGDLTIDRRASFDALLSFYSLIELGHLEGLLEADPVLMRTAKAHLTHVAVRRYYEDYYPLLLPRLLRQRIEGRPAVSMPATTLSKPYRRFTRFLDMDRMLDDADAAPDEWTDVEEFWWMLDDGTSADGYTIDELVEAFRRKATVRDAILGANESDLDCCIRGLYQFLRFANELEQFLAELPVLLASAYWHYYGYWFERMGDSLMTVVERTLPQLEANDQDVARLIQRVGRLTSGRYRWPLKEALQGPPMIGLSGGTESAYSAIKAGYIVVPEKKVRKGQESFLERQRGDQTFLAE